MHVSLAHTTVILNGHTVRGWGDDAESLVLPDIEVGDPVVGADGKLMIQSTGETGGSVMLKLMPDAPSTQYFMQQMAAILGGAQVVWNGSIDYHNGSRVRLQNGGLIKGPAGQTLGKSSAAMREWEFRFEIVLPNYDAANFTESPPVNVN